MQVTTQLEGYCATTGVLHFILDIDELIRPLEHDFPKRRKQRIQTKSIQPLEWSIRKIVLLQRLTNYYTAPPRPWIKLHAFAAADVEHCG